MKHRHHRILSGTILLASIMLLPACDTEQGDFEPDKKPGVSSATGTMPKNIDLACHGCNVILLNIELLRADQIGLLNPGEPSVTPNIDRFFARSLIFEQVSAPAGESYRSNLAVQTAMHSFHYPADQRSIDIFAKRSTDVSSTIGSEQLVSMLTRYTTIPEIYLQQKFHTIGLNQGIRAGERLLLDRGFDDHVNWGRVTTSYRDTISTLIHKLQATSGKFFLLYRPEALHPFPYYYPDDLEQVTVPGKIHYQAKPRFNRFNIRFNRALPEEEKRKVHRMIYRQQLKFVDHELKRVFSSIVHNKLDRNSIIVLYSNHGSGLGDNGVDKLGVSYQSCIHVPLLIRVPSLDRQIRIETPVSLIDLAPTLYEISGITGPLSINGRSLLRETGDDYGFEQAVIGRNDTDEYIRRGNLKLIIKNGEHRELYDLNSDPHETKNVLAARLGVARNLESELIAKKIEILREAAENSAVQSKEGGRVIEDSTNRTAL